MLLSELMGWLSPLAWWLVELAWLCLAIFSLSRPGGIGSRLFLTGTALSFVLSTVTTIDGFWPLFSGDGGLWDSDVIYYAFDVAWLLSSALAIGGLFLILLHVHRILADAGAARRAALSPPPIHPGAAGP